MVPLVSFLAALRILTEAQSCNNGVGKLVYEKIADYKLSAGFGGGRQRVELEDRTTAVAQCLSFDFMPGRRRPATPATSTGSAPVEFEESVCYLYYDRASPDGGETLVRQNNAWHFNEITRAEQPVKVLEECVRRCQEDRTTAVAQCLSFDFMPGRRRPATPATSTGSAPVEFEESVCYLYYDRASPDGGETLVRQNNAWHFNEVCLSWAGDKEVFASNRTDCEDKCLGEIGVVCRSATFDRAAQRCRLSPETKYMNSQAFKQDANSEYVENLCLPNRSAGHTGGHGIAGGGATSGGGYAPHPLPPSTGYGSPAHGVHGAGGYHHGWHGIHATHRGYPGPGVIPHGAGIGGGPVVSHVGGHGGLPGGGLGSGYDPGYPPSRWPAGGGYPPGRGSSVASPGSQLCTTTAFILEAGKELDGAFEREVVSTRDLQECSNYCTRSLPDRGYFCRSFLFDDKARTCTLYDEDPLGYGEGTESHKPLKTSTGDLYRVLCGSSERDRSAGHSGGHGIGGGGATSGGGTGYGSPAHGVHGAGGYHHGWHGIHATHRGYPGPGVIPHGGGIGGGPVVSHVGGHGGLPGGGLGSGYDPGYPPSRWPAGGFSSGGYGGGGYGTPYGGVPSSGGGVQQHSHGAGGGFPAHPPPPPPPHVHPPLPPVTGGGAPPFAPPLPPGLAEKCKFSSAVFRRVGYGTRLKSFYVRRVVRTERLEECEQACSEARDIHCKSFNFRAFFPDNCELSDYDSRQLQLSNPSHFDQSTQFDYYERDDLGHGPGGAGGGDCLDVSQTCTPDGMEFTLRTVDGFYGRIYTYGFYDSCFYDGNGGSVNVLRISRGNGFPRCGTQTYGDVMTNIVVVQFNDYVQTSRDKKYNLTCYFSGPGEAVVTRYPTQIEHLPAQNILTSNVQLRILYRGTPTTTIAVGDLLTFRLEARGKYQFDFYSDIFATNVIAKDPYSGRQVHLIDSRGCPVDLYVFPELHKAPDGALEAEFYAFKIPDSNLLVFQATVRTCRGPCEPVICSDRGRPGTFPSWGRRKRAVSKQLGGGPQVAVPVALPVMKMNASSSAPAPTSLESAIPSPKNLTSGNSTDDEAEEVRELLHVYLSRADIPHEAPSALYKKPTVCVAQSGYYALVTMLALLICA
ncbi:no-mechanoreceptor potential A, putative [Ixodes scapularis]|uniref:No-mechanoreceptor potential A, putative n=1 Tax=Ixodes scapularis TaxID=6945 RepID=B7QCV3_IXOSC|nr:no-mechanoreceptor potential A, putative [Ixodes scapularis]|eukprot:XP_002413367.1 no-mechanoreceptor potential A, putative [Ixodes scapularis]